MGADRKAQVKMQAIMTRLMQHCHIDGNGCWIWTGCRSQGGYGKTHICIGKGAVRRISAHRLIAHLFYGLDLTDRSNQANHKCDVRLCFNPDHIYVGSQKQNVADCMQRKRRADIRGNRNPQTKLTETQVRSIQDRCATGPRGTKTKIAREYGISEALVRKISMGTVWGWLK